MTIFCVTTDFNLRLIFQLENLKKGDTLRKDKDEFAEANLMKDKNERLETGKANLGYEDDEKVMRKKKNATPKMSNERT